MIRGDSLCSSSFSLLEDDERDEEDEEREYVCPTLSVLLLLLDMARDELVDSPIRVGGKMDGVSCLVEWGGCCLVRAAATSWWLSSLFSFRFRARILKCPRLKFQGRVNCALKAWTPLCNQDDVKTQHNSSNANDDDKDCRRNNRCIMQCPQNRASRVLFLKPVPKGDAMMFGLTNNNITSVW